MSGNVYFWKGEGSRRGWWRQEGSFAQEQLKVKLSSHLSSPTTLHNHSHHRTASFLSEAQHKGVNLNFYLERVWLQPKTISLCSIFSNNPEDWLGEVFFWVVFFILQMLRVVVTGLTRIEPTNKQATPLKLSKSKRPHKIFFSRGFNEDLYF